MRELFSMWRNTRMVVLTAITAALYAAVLIPFKVAVILPAISELRPGIALPIVCSFLFGPAAAWGAGIGNIIGDVFGGMFGLGSVFGFLGNVFLGFLPYKLWTSLTGAEPVPRNMKDIIRYLYVVIVASAACALTVGTGVHLLGFFPFFVTALTILINNSLFAAILGPLLLAILYPRVKRLGLLYQDIMGDEVRRGRLYPAGIVLVTVAVAAGLVAGVFMSRRAARSGGDLQAFYAGQSGDRLCVAFEVHGQPGKDFSYAVEVAPEPHEGMKYLIAIPGEASKAAWMLSGKSIGEHADSGTPAPGVKHGVNHVTWAEIPLNLVGKPTRMKVRPLIKRLSDGRVNDDCEDRWLEVSVPERFSSAAELPDVRGAAKLSDSANDYAFGASRAKLTVIVALLAAMLGMVLL